MTRLLFTTPIPSNFLSQEFAFASILCRLCLLITQVVYCYTGFRSETSLAEREQVLVLTVWMLLPFSKMTFLTAPESFVCFQTLKYDRDSECRVRQTMPGQWFLSTQASGLFEFIKLAEEKMPGKRRGKSISNSCNRYAFHSQP